MDDTPSTMKHRPTRGVVVVAFILAVLVLPGTLAWSILHISAVSDQAHAYQVANTKALCALRQDVQERVTSGETFLRLHPRGILGISGATLRANITGQERTVIALRFVHCSAPTPAPVKHCTKHCDGVTHGVKHGSS